MLETAEVDRYMITVLLTTASTLQGPAIQMVRRHARSSDQVHFGPALSTVTGNWVAAKHKGVIDGVDFGCTGMVGAITMTVVSISTLDLRA